jgi:DNA-binding response OmpR family regulator
VRAAIAEHGVNCELSVIPDGAKAIAYLDEIDSSSSRCPDLVVLDLNLPLRTGLEVLQRIRGTGSCSQMPVVILSSSEAHRDKMAALTLGANRYISKPYDLEEFLKIGSTLKDMLSEGEK